MPVYEEKEKINGQKRYYIRTYVTDENGNKRQITRHSKEWTGRDGYWLACSKEAELKSKKVYQDSNLTLDELFERYFDDINLKLKKSSAQKHLDNYKIYIKNFLGYKKVKDITTKDVLDFHNYLNTIERKTNSKTSKRKSSQYLLSTSYKKTIHITLSATLQFGCKYYNLEKNVASIVGNFKSAKGTGKKELYFLTKSEFEKFIKEEKNKTYQNFFTLLFYTGLRRGELLALTKNDLDLNHNEMKINKSINPKNGILATIPKTDKSNRTLKMLKNVNDLFLEIKETTPTEEIFGLKNIKPTTLQRKCDNNCKLAGITKNIRIHDFRHSFASLCIEKGVPIELLSEYLGHENISTTLNTYAHLYPNSQDKLVAILDERPIKIKLDKQQELIDSIMSFISMNLLKGKSVKEITAFLSNTDPDYFLK